MARDKTPVDVLKEEFRGTRVSFRWWYSRKTVGSQVKQKMAQAVRADAGSISGSKRIYGDHPTLRAVAARRAEIETYWQSATIPYTQKGVRLIRVEERETFDQRMVALFALLRADALAVQAARAEIMAEARERLQEAFSEADYPLNLADRFSVEWSFPVLDEPQGDLPPAVWERQRLQFEANLQQAVLLAEREQARQLLDLITALQDALAPQDGRRRRICASTVEAFEDFFARFSRLSVGSNEELEYHIALARDILGGVTAEDLRKAPELRQQVRDDLRAVREYLEGTADENEPEEALAA